MLVTVIKKTESVIYNGNIYSDGQSFEVDDVIGESLMKRGYVAIAVTEDEGEADKAPESVNLDEVLYTELKKMAARLGLSTKGTKEALRARIKEAEATVADEAEADATADAPAEDETAGDLPDTSMPE